MIVGHAHLRESREPTYKVATISMHHHNIMILHRYTCDAEEEDTSIPIYRSRAQVVVICKYNLICVFMRGYTYIFCADVYSRYSMHNIIIIYARIVEVKEETCQRTFACNYHNFFLLNC